jgi:hypothetical protein
MQNGGRCAEFLIQLLVNLWAHLRSQWFLSKAVSKYLLCLIAQHLAFEELRYCFLKLDVLFYNPISSKHFNLFKSLPTLIFFITTILVGVKWYLITVLIYISLVTNNALFFNYKIILKKDFMLWFVTCRLSTQKPQHPVFKPHLSIANAQTPSPLSYNGI